MPSTNPVQKPVEPSISAQPMQGTIRRLLQLSVRGLAQMFDESQQLFCYSLNQTEVGMKKEGLSQRYTMMCLLGLHRLEQSGVASPFDRNSMLQALFSNLSWVDNIGDVGVLLWMCSIVCPERLQEVRSRLHPEVALTNFRDARPHGQLCRPGLSNLRDGPDGKGLPP